MRKYKNLLSAFFIIIGAFFLVSCNASTSFESSVTSGNYADAIALYRDKLSGNSSKELEAKNFLLEYMQNTLSDYASGQIDDQKAASVYDCLLKLDNELYILNVELGRSLEQFTILQSSKENYIAAVAAIEDENFEKAVELFAEVSETDVENYESAVKQRESAYNSYKARLFSEVDELIGQKNFSQAYNKLIDGDYLLSDDEQYKNRCITTVETWADDVLRRASDAFGTDKDYESAIKVLQSSGVQGDVIDAEIAKYQEYIPRYLAELEYTQKVSYINVGSHSDSITTDLQGTTYDGEYLIYPTGGDLASQVATTEDEAYINYFLNAEYSKLVGTLYVPYKALSSTREWKNPTTVKIYGDEILLYEAPQFTIDTIEPLLIEVDITGVRELKIVMLGVWTEDTTWVGLYSRQPKVCAANFSISK